jgi:phospholipase/carboxylesterase
MNMDYSLNNVINQPGLPLAHRVRMPANGSAKNSPCLILLHGVGANEANLVGFAQQQDPRLVVILARAPLTFGPNQYGWFNVNFTAIGPVINAEQAEQSRQTLIEFIDALPAAYGIDAAQIWVAGFSQGGILSASVGLTRPDKVAGFGILSGRILPEIAPLIASTDALKDTHAFVSHGIDDGKLSINYARTAKNVLSESGVQLTYHEYDAEHELNASMQRDFIEWITAQLDAK